MRSKRTIFHLLFFLLASAPLLAQEEQDEIPADLPEGTVFNDSLEVVVDSTQMEVGIVDTKIHLLSRTYGDSIVLRWAPEDYATWRYVNRVGMDVLRYSEDHPFDADTLAHRLRPYTLEQFRQRYPTTDTLAMTAAGLLYDENRTRPTATKNPPGTLGSLYEIYQEQQMRYAFALLTTEWRRDLADALAMRLVDKTAKRGKTYEYIVRPSEIDTTGQMIVRTGHIPELKNERYKPEPFVTTLTDSTIAENSVQLTWNRKLYSSFEIERRGPLSPSGAPLPASASSLSPASTSPSNIPASPSTSKATVPDGSPSGNWTRVTPKPYIDMSPNTQGRPDTLYTMTDQVPQVGLYDYRLLAHDAFGDLTEPTKPFRVWVRDITPPSPPAITLITIDRRDSTDLSKGVFATFHLRKDTMEADYTGWHLVYYHEKDTEKQWRRLSPQQTPADTLLTLDVTGISTGMVAVAASDTANNTSYSIATMLRLEDLKAPGVPQNLRAQGNPLQGTITLDWDAPEDLDIDYYEVAYANDSTHRWVLATEQKLHDTHFVDTIDVTANQKYIYYKVRAIDYSTNEGFYSPVLQVIRPTLIPPVVAHIDSTWVDDNGIHMRWITSAEHFVSHHLVWRRLHTDKEWTLLAVCNADSLADYDYELTLHDKPEYTREARYDYAIETISYSGVSSEKSLAYSVRWEGDAVFSLPLKLYGEYLEDKQETRLVWEMPQEPPYKGRWYFCIFRQGPDDKAPTFLISAAKDDRIFSDHLLDPGQQASYFIRVKYADGRQSEDSNTVTVKRKAQLTE